MKQKSEPSIPRGHGIVNLNHWEKARAVLVRATMVQELNGDGLRAICGEMTAQEIRTVRAIVNYILRA